MTTQTPQPTSRPFSESELVDIALDAESQAEAFSLKASERQSDYLYHFRRAVQEQLQLGQPAKAQQLVDCYRLVTPRAFKSKGGAAYLQSLIP